MSGDKLMEVMKNLLKDPEANKELLAPHKVDTSGYEKQVKEEQTAGMPEQKQGYSVTGFTKKVSACILRLWGSNSAWSLIHRRGTSLLYPRMLMQKFIPLAPSSMTTTAS